MQAIVYHCLGVTAEDNDVVALAEMEKEPEDYIAQQKFTMNKVQTGFNIPLEFFDNPEVDLQHPSIELIMVSLEKGKLVKEIRLLSNAQIYYRLFLQCFISLQIGIMSLN